MTRRRDLTIRCVPFFIGDWCQSWRTMGDLVVFVLNILRVLRVADKSALKLLKMLMLLIRELLKGFLGSKLNLT